MPGKVQMECLNLSHFSAANLLQKIVFPSQGVCVSYRKKPDFALQSQDASEAVVWELQWLFQPRGWVHLQEVPLLSGQKVRIDAVLDFF